jgi:hypothetical protein
MKKYYMIIALVVFVLLGILFTLRVISGEDDWICQNGEWVRHGHPSSEKPIGECKK